MAGQENPDLLKENSSGEQFPSEEENKMGHTGQEEAAEPSQAEFAGEPAEGEIPQVEESDAEETVQAEEAAETGADCKTDVKKKGDEKKKGLFKKKDKAQEQIEELNDRLKRQMAEFDNFRKRTEKEKAQMYEIGAKSIIEKILPVVDNFERGLAAIPEDGKEDAFVQGMNKIYKQLMTELENMGVKAIEALGQEFNPDFHNAVMQTESGEYESGIIAQELLKGYMYRDSVIRHSMVAVTQ